MFFSYENNKIAALFSKKTYKKVWFTIKTNQINDKIKKNQIFICQYSLRMQYKYMRQDHKKRTSYAASEKDSQRKKASLTVEASIVFPIFVLAFFLFIYGAKIVELQSKIQYALEVTAMELADYAVTKDADTKALALAGNLVYSNEGAGILFEKNFQKCNADRTMLSNTVVPFSFGNSKILKENQAIYLVVKYKIKVPGFSIFFRDKNISCVQNTCLRAFVGVSVKEWSENQIVYITTGEQVYHTNRNCTHIKLSIQKVSAEEFWKKKEYHQRYSGCVLCGSKMEGDYYYITEDGKRYHKSILCKGLKRTVERIPLHQAGGRSLCSRCATKK